MESKTKFLGHPVHPMLIVIPLGLFVTTMIVDTIYLFTRNPILPAVAFFNIAIGVVAGLVAAFFGMHDWMAIPLNTRARSIAGWHGLGNVAVVTMFGISWWLRSNVMNYMPTQLALILSYGGFLLGGVTAWLGGELVYRLSVGVDHGANLDAPSSLSEQPARAASSSSSSRTVTNRPARAKR